MALYLRLPNNFAHRETFRISIGAACGFEGSRAFVGLLSDPRPEVRRLGLEVLKEMGDARLTPAFSLALRDSVPYVRQGAVYALERSVWASVDRHLEPASYSEAITLLVSALGDEDGEVRDSAFWALSGLADDGVSMPAAVPGLEAMLHDDSEAVRTLAAKVLMNIRSARK